MRKSGRTLCYLDAGNGLAQPSLDLLEQIRTVDKRRLSDYIGRLNETHIRGINHALAIPAAFDVKTVQEGTAEVMSLVCCDTVEYPD